MTEKRYWDEEMETKSRDEMRSIQESKILKTLSYVYENSAFHKKLWNEKGIQPRDIKTLEDFQSNVPCFNKEMLRAYRDENGDAFCGMLCVPTEQCIYSSMSSGTTGEATYPIFTKRDMDIAAENGARNLWTQGLRPRKRLLYDLPHHPIICSMVGGAIKLGALALNKAVPITSEFELERHVATFKYFKPDVWFLLSPPAVSIMGDYFKKKSIDPKNIFPKGMVAVYGGEPVTEGMRKSIFNEWGIEILSQGGTGDFCWINTECHEHDGLHCPDDLTFVEVVDPKTNVPVPAGEKGELAITTLEMQAAPVIRFKMDDIVTMTDKSCTCGRTTSRLYYYDRKVNETIIAGKSIFPIEIRQLLEEFPETKDGIGQIVRYADKMETLKVRVGYDPVITKDIKKLEAKVQTTLYNALGVRSIIEFVSMEQIKSLSHKFPRILKEY